MRRKLRPRWMSMLAAAVLVSATTGIGVVIAGQADTRYERDVITACYEKDDGRLRIIDNCGDCRPSESCLYWNVAGPRGEQGPPGPAGLEGAAGECSCEITRAEFDALVARVAALEAPGLDLDGDGYPGDVDCDDEDPLIYPGADEVCDDRDNDCDGAIDEDFDLASDPANCGWCGHVCANPHGDAVCTDGLCSPVCEPGYGDCDGDPDNGCEVHLLTDPDNCGACGNVCDLPNAEEMCEDGTCQIAQCESLYGDCDGDPANGCETDLSANPSHCGACGHVCDLPHAEARCVSGSCEIAMCHDGYADCDGVADNGCEVHLDGGKCEDALELGSICGDAVDVVLTASGPGQAWYMVELRECDRDSGDNDLYLRVELVSPPGTDYDLYLYEPCGNLVDTSDYVDRDPGFAWVDAIVEDDWASNDTTRFYIEVRRRVGLPCDEWTLSAFSESWIAGPSVFEYGGGVRPRIDSKGLK